jgi:hypothetical protein
MGAYRLDLPWTLERLGEAASEPQTQRRLESLIGQYRAGQMLQPYKRDRGDPWSFRWIPQVRRAACTPLPSAPTPGVPLALPGERTIQGD